MTKEMLEMMTVKELRNYVKDNGLEIAKAYELRKVELVAAILDAENEMDCDKEDVLSNQEILEKEEECLNHEDDCIGFSPDMFAEAVELENSRTDYGNGWEEIAKKNIKYAYEWIVGENENVLQDEDEDSSAYKASYEYLHSGNEIMEDIYHEAITTEYDAGYCGGKAPGEMRFAGKEFCKNLIIDLLKKDGYYNEPVEDKSQEEILDEVVPDDTSSVKSSDEIFYEESKENAKPVIKKLRKNVKYICPVCGGSAKNKYNFCYKCGLLLNHDSETYDKIAKSGMANSYQPKKKVINKNKNRCTCPSCNAKIWKGDNFCSYCGQEIEDNA